MIKKIFLFAVVLAALLAINSGTSVQAQSMYFCGTEPSSGRPVDDYDAFTIANEGDYIYVLVKLPYDVACYSVRFEIYRNGTYDNTIYMDTQKDWQWFYKKITFNKTGNYSFYCYDSYDYNLCSGSVKISWR
jgi:hypothetical protein